MAGIERDTCLPHIQPVAPRNMVKVQRKYPAAKENTPTKNRVGHEDEFKIPKTYHVKDHLRIL